MITPQTFISAKKFLRGFRQIMQWAVFTLHHVRIKIRRTTDGLAGIIDDEIEPLIFRDHMTAKRLDAGRVAQVESENLKPMPPVLKIQLLRITHRRITGKTGGDDEMRAGA